MYWKNFGTLIYLLIFISGYQIADAQQGPGTTSICYL